MTDRAPRERLRRKADRGFQGYPLATLAFYGQDNQRASKVVVGIVYREGEKVRELEKWFSDASDVREDELIGRQVLAFLQKQALCGDDAWCDDRRVTRLRTLVGMGRVKGHEQGDS